VTPLDESASTLVGQVYREQGIERVLTLHEIEIKNSDAWDNTKQSDQEEGLENPLNTMLISEVV